MILQSGSVELMYQTRASVEAEHPSLADTPMGGNLLFVQVDDIDAVEAAGCQVVKVISILDRHEGGSDEIRRRGYDFLSLLEADTSGRIGPTGASGP